MVPLQKYYSNAKLLITGEYLVLHGALALAVPLKFGQSLEVYASDTPGIEWIARENGRDWLNLHLTAEQIETQEEAGKDPQSRLCYLLKAAREMNSDFLEVLNCKVITDMNFDRSWGLGSSSTLIANVAQWAGVDPFGLHFKVSNGSGYDIACATAKGPLLFQREGERVQVQAVDYDPSFKDDLWFVYLGKKQNSEASVRSFLKDVEVEERHLKRISSMTRAILKADRSDAFDLLIREHERLLASLLGQQRIRLSQFHNLLGEIKSLGAWGGDFALLRTDWSREELSSYLNQNGLRQFFSWDEMVLNTHNKNVGINEI